MIGKTLGHYEITGKLGKGGMGEVYRAKDLKLGRDVAIKVLPEEFARDADRVARFQREAKLLASLNHPNIAAIYGLEESGGTQFLVLELVEGETLSDQVKRGAMPVEESVKLALQIAEALEAAHEKGVIHRDLKPANIKVTPEGKVKVLDFGLAKAFAGEQAELNLSNSPTLSDIATQQGVILGTAAYMAPEQARGRPVDKRADIWAFGCVLFEMLTGRAAFSGRDVTDILAAVIRAEPDWTKLPANLHWRIREVLERCLEKEAKNRCSGISDARVQIQKALADPGGLFVQPAVAAAPKSRMRLGLSWIAAIVTLSVIIAAVAVWKLKPPEPRQVLRFDYELPEGRQFGDLNFPALAVSPDGKKFVHSTSNGLYIRSADESTAKLIAGTEGNTQNPFFSPDGKWIGYFSTTDSKLKKIAVNGGFPVVLCGAESCRGAWWSKDNNIAYSRFGRDIMRIPAHGGTPDSIVKLKSAIMVTDPQILPDGKSILYTSYSNDARPTIMVQSLKSGETIRLFTGLSARYIPAKHIIFKLPNNSDLFAIPFDPYSLKVTGESIRIVEGVRQFAVSDSGTLAYIPGTAGGAAPRQTLVWVNREGKEEPLPVDLNDYWWFKISPDGTRVALTAGASVRPDIWIWDILRETKIRLTLDEGAYNSSPLWTPDGKRIVYSSSRENIFLLADICWKAADGTGEGGMLASSQEGGLFPWSCSRDGKILVVWEYTRSGHSNLLTLSMEGDHLRKPLLLEKYNESYPRISPDGRWMAYTSNESGKNEIYARPFPDVDKRKWPVSTGGGYNPLWSPDGRELFYYNGNAVMAVPVETEPDFRPGKPKALFRGSYYCPAGFYDVIFWDISPDGKRFLIMKEDKQAAAEVPRKINIVVNWFEELKQRVPVK